MDENDQRLPMQEADINQSLQPLVCVNPKSQKHTKKASTGRLVTQKLPPSPEDCCTLCDPVCADDFKLAVVSTFCCWMWLGLLPIFAGFVAIHYAKKARITKHPLDREYYSNVSRTISWLGMLLFTICITILVIVLATCGIL